MGAEARAVAAVCMAEILGLAGFSLVPALLPQFIATWSLSNAEAGWLAGMMSGGYMAGVLPLVALTDRVPARTIYLACSALIVSMLQSSVALPPWFATQNVRNTTIHCRSPAVPQIVVA